VRDDTGSRMVIPRHTHGYYRIWKEDAPFVFVYQHTGSESDRSLFPQCELIILWNIATKSSDYIFAYDSKVSVSVRKFFDNMRSIYNQEGVVINIHGQPPWTVLSDRYQLVSQYIDSYGKTRVIDFSFNGLIIRVFTSPMQPLAKIPEMDVSTPVENIPVESISDFFNLLNITFYDTGKGHIIGNTNNIELVVYYDKPPSPEGNSFVDKYNTTKRNARYITEYFLWLYSVYTAETNDGTISGFKDNYIEIDNSFVYNINENILSLDNPSVMRNRKLVLTSNKLLARLEYVLELHIVRNQKKLTQYRHKKRIDNFYVDVSDFNKHTGQDVIDKTTTTEHEIDNVHYISNKIITGTRSPYFFRNNLVENGKIFLAQNIESLEVAFFVADNWNSVNRFNPGYNFGNNVEDEFWYESLEKPAFTLYSYTNSSKIQKYSVKAQPNANVVEYNLKVVGHKNNDGEAVYTVLLEM
jgi:hypothetical protein